MADLKGRATLDTGPFTKGLKTMEGAAGAAADHIKSRFSSLTAPLLAVGAAVSAAFAGHAIVSGVADVFALGGALEHMSEQTGISVRNLVVLRKNFADAGLEADDLGVAVGKMQKYLEEALGDDKKIQTLQGLGLSFADLRRQKPEDQFYDIGRALSQIANPGERAAKAMELFGKSGAKLGVVFNDATFGIASEKLQARAEMLDRNAKRFEEISNKLNGPAGVLKSFSAGVADVIAPAFLGVLNQVNKIDLSGIGRSFGDGLVSVFSFALTVARAIVALPWEKVFEGVANVFAGMFIGIKRAVGFVSEKISSIAKMLSGGVLGSLFGGGGSAAGSGHSASTPPPSGGGMIAGGLSMLTAAFTGAWTKAQEGVSEPSRVVVGPDGVSRTYLRPAETTNERRARFIRDAKERNPTGTNEQINAEMLASEAAFQKRQQEEKIRAQRSGKTAPDESFDRAFHPEKFKDVQVSQFDQAFNPTARERKPQIGQGKGDTEKPHQMSMVEMLLKKLDELIGATNSI